MPRRANHYTATGIDRAAHLRTDAAWIAERLSAPETRIVPVWRSRNLVDGEGPAPRPVLLSASETWWRAIDGAEPVLLGLRQSVAYFALDLSAVEAPEEHPELRGRGCFVDLRTVATLLPWEDAGLFAHARGLAWWHARHRFCGVCGHPTVSAEAGHQRLCTNPDCAAPHFPRTDPAVIMLVHDGDRCLLGRNPRLPPGMHSTLAGFVEPGEALEEAVAREVFEETGVRVADVRYHSSQPWPFPSSLMVGFHARAATTEIRIDPNELESAAWFARDELLRVEETGALRLPRADSIARRLIEDWLAGEA